MLLESWDAIDSFIRPLKTEAAHMERGYIKVEFQDIEAHYADGQRVGTMMGLDIRRKASLAYGDIQYYGADDRWLCDNLGA